MNKKKSIGSDTSIGNTDLDELISPLIIAQKSRLINQSMEYYFSEKKQIPNDNKLMALVKNEYIFPLVLQFRKILDYDSQIQAINTILLSYDDVLVDLNNQLFEIKESKGHAHRLRRR